MSAYMQMGHDTENLIGESGLEKFSGIIFSPVNRDEQKLSVNLAAIRSKAELMIFDPQLYFPSGMRGCLNQHSYYPSDFESADSSNEGWWNSLSAQLDAYVSRYKYDCVATPALIPRTYSPSYFEHFVKVGNHFRSISSIPRVWQSVLIDASTLSDELIMRYTSILSLFEGEGFYVVFESSVTPRREYSDTQTLTAMMKFIRELKCTGKEVIIAFASSEMSLLKVAGADSFGTGKFFNLRRFSRTRFEDEKSGGRGILPYMFEENLFAFLREADIASMISNGNRGMLFGNSSNNQWSEKIMNAIYQEREPWVKYSWRHYLAWFSEYENRKHTTDSLKESLREAEQRWQYLQNNDVLFEEAANDGSWIRPWRVALQNFTRS